MLSRWILGFALAWIGLLWGIGIAAAAAPKNVILIVTDDQAHDTIAAAGHAQIQTPHLDQLWQRGFRFRNAYCMGGQSPAVCVPSRVMLLTGRSTFHTPAYQAKTYESPTLGQTFRRAGFHTVCVSKPGNSFRPAHDAFERVVHIPHIGPATNKVYFDAAIEAFDQAPASQPVFLYLAPSMPHDPRTAEPRFHDLYNPQTIRLPADFRATVPVDFGVLQIRDEQLAAYPRNPDEMRRHLADYYACITSLDYHLGRLLEALKSRGQLEQTLIIFTSDQGLAVGGRHGLMGKQNLYESFKSPLIIAGPGIPTGESQALVYLHDLYPTICELTGVPIPSTCQGQSLGPILRGTQPRVREHLFAVYMDTQRMVRDERFKLLWYPKLTRFELFDLATDPDEQIDLAAQPAHQAVLTRLKTAMRDQQLAQGDRIPVLGTP